MSKAQSYCYEILPHVSRTFALNISVLTGDLHKEVLTSYLLCRIADTFEDSSSFSIDQKISLLKSFLEICEEKTCDQKKIFDMKTSFESQIDPSHSADHELLSHCECVFVFFDSLQNQAKQIIRQCLREMCLGMTIFLKRQSESQVIVQSYNDLQEYCYYVAGTVGILLKELFCLRIKHLPLSSRKIMEKTMLSFGEALQMTNILKDVFKDNERNVCYLPEELLKKWNLTRTHFFEKTSLPIKATILNELIEKTLVHLDLALEYTLALPRRERKLRLFCLWPLFFAFHTLIVLKRSCVFSDQATDKDRKISRKTVFLVLFLTRMIFWNNTLLSFYYKTLTWSIARKKTPSESLDK